MRIPAVLYVKAGKDSDGSIWYEAHSSFKDFEEDGDIAVFRLTEVKKMETTKTLRFK